MRDGNGVEERWWSGAVRDGNGGGFSKMIGNDSKRDFPQSNLPIKYMENFRIPTLKSYK